MVGGGDQTCTQTSQCLFHRSLQERREELEALKTPLNRRRRRKMRRRRRMIDEDEEDMKEMEHETWSQV